MLSTIKNAINKSIIKNINYKTEVFIKIEKVLENIEKKCQFRI